MYKKLKEMMKGIRESLEFRVESLEIWRILRDLDIGN